MGMTATPNEPAPATPISSIPAANIQIRGGDAISQPYSSDACAPDTGRIDVVGAAGTL